MIALGDVVSLALLYRARSSNRFTDVDGFVYGNHKYFSVTDRTVWAGTGYASDDFEGPFEKIVIDDDFDLDFPEHVRFVFMAAIRLRVSTLATVALRIADSHTLDPATGQRIFDGIQLGRLDNRNDHFHRVVFGFGRRAGPWYLKATRLNATGRRATWRRYA